MESVDTQPKSHWTNYLSRTRRVFYMPSELIFLWITWICYIVGFRLAHINQMDTIYKYTYLEPSYAPGNLTSGRNGPLYISEILISVIREFTVILTLPRLLFFRTKLIINTHIFFMFPFALFEAAVAIMIGLKIEKCNKEADNPCNSYKWCGVYGVNSTTCPQMYPAPVFPNTTAIPYVAQWTPSTLTLDDLSWNLEFSISFFLALYMTLLTALMWLWSVLSRNPTKPITETYEMVNSKMTNADSGVRGGSSSSFDSGVMEYNHKFQ